MKPYRWLVVAVLTACLGACGGETSGPSLADPATITILPQVDTLMTTGAVYGLTATVFDGHGQVIVGALPDWSSSDTSVVIVSDRGQLRARRNGTATISARMGKAVGQAKVVVEIRGALRVIVSVTGGGHDPDGYDLILASTWFHISRDTTLVPNLVPGQQLVGLGAIRFPCRVSIDPIEATVLPDDTIDVIFAMRCAGRFAYIGGNLLQGELGYVDEFATARRLAGAKIQGRPAWSPDGTRLVYVQQADSMTDLYTVRLDGSGTVRLTTDADQEAAPAWSPDGKRIAFLKGASGRLRLQTMAPDGSDVRVVVDESAGLQDGPAGLPGGPAWSPGGDAIAVARTTNGVGRLSVVAPDGSGLRDLTSGYSDESPVWSPDGRWIAFVRNVPGANRSVMIMAADGSAIREVVRSDLGAYAPVWSPDGRRIAYVKNKVGGWGVWIINADGTDDHPLTSQYWLGSDPAWTPDGGHLLLTIPNGNITGIGMVEPDGTGLELVFGPDEARTPLVRPH